MTGEEKRNESAIMSYLRANNCWVQKVHSGAIMKSYKDRNGHTKQYKINLADKGTPDLIACVPTVITSEMVGKTIGKFVGIEVKKDEATCRQWRNYKGHANEQILGQQHQCGLIQESGGLFILTHSFKELKQDLL